MEPMAIWEEQILHDNDLDEVGREMFFIVHIVVDSITMLLPSGQLIRPIQFWYQNRGSNSASPVNWCPVPKSYKFVTAIPVLACWELSWFLVFQLPDGTEDPPEHRPQKLIWQTCHLLIVQVFCLDFWVPSTYIRGRSRNSSQRWRPQNH